MTLRRHLATLALGALLALPLGAAPAAADDRAAVEASVLASLRDQGYEIIDVHRTLLGRLRVLAETDALRREIVVNPHTGEILRDYAFALPTAPLPDRRPDDNRSSGGVGVAASEVLADDTLAPTLGEPLVTIDGDVAVSSDDVQSGTD